MNARAEEQRVLPKEEKQTDVIFRQSSVCGAYGNYPDTQQPLRMAPIPSPYTFNPEEIGMLLSDDEQETAQTAVKSFHKDANKEEEDEGNDGFAWYAPEDDEEDNNSSSSLNQTSSAASGSSLSSTSSSPLPDTLLDGASPLSSPTSTDLLGSLPRAQLTTRSVSSGGPRIEATLEMSTSGTTFVSIPASYPSTTSSSRAITRALSSPDLKKGHFLHNYREGQDMTRSKSTAWTHRSHRDKVARQSKEFRQCFFHYMQLLLTDLLQRKIKQKGVALRAM